MNNLVNKKTNKSNHSKGYDEICKALLKLGYAESLPNSRPQKLRVTDRGRQWLAKGGGFYFDAASTERDTSRGSASTESVGTDADPDENVVADDIEEIRKSVSVETVRNALIAARLGQGQFRRAVLKIWGYACAVTGSTTRDAIRASHIKPWRDSTNDERLDPYNGLPLIANLDALFDKYLISFDQAGNILVSSQLDPTDKTIFVNLQGKLRSLPLEVMKKIERYLKQHRKRFKK